MEFFTATGKLKKFFFATLMEFFTATGKLKKIFFCHTPINMLTVVWQELEYHIDMCCVTRGAHIERL
jgi:hypothetical protein